MKENYMKFQWNLNTTEIKPQNPSFYEVYK